MKADRAAADAGLVNNRAVESAQAGDLETAMALLRESLDLWAQAGSPASREHAATLQNLGTVASRLGQAEEAKRSWLDWAALERRRWPTDDPQRADALDEVALLLNSAGDVKDAETLVREALDLRLQHFGEGHPQVARSLDNLGNLRLAAGDLGEARPLLERALAIRSATLPPRHPGIVESQTSLATTALAEGDALEAERGFAAVVQALESRLGPSDPQVASANEALAEARRTAGDLYGARLALRSVVDARRSTGAVSRELARAVNNLADIDYAVGDWQAARDGYAEAVGLLTAPPGPQHPIVGDVVTNLANAERNLGHFGAAHRHYERALAIFRAMGPDGEGGVRRVLADLQELTERSGELPPEQLVETALRYLRNADLPAAERLARQAVEVRRGGPAAAEALLVLGNILLAADDLEGARAAYEEAIGGGQSSLETSDAAILAGLAEVHRRLGDEARADSLHAEVSERLQTSGAAAGAGYTRALANLGYAAMRRGDHAAALDMLARAVALAEKDGSNSELATMLTGLALVQMRGGDAAAGRDTLERALPLARKALGPRHPEVAEALLLLGLADEASGDLMQAETSMREAYLILRETLGEEHADTAAAARPLARVLLALGAQDEAETLLRGALESLRLRPSGRGSALAQTQLALSDVLRERGERLESMTLLRESAEMLRSSLPAGHPVLSAALSRVGAAYLEIGALAAAESMLVDSLVGVPASEATSGQRAAVLQQMATLHRARGDRAKAERTLRESLAILEASSSPDPRRTAGLYRDLAHLYAAAGRWDEAVDAVQRAMALSDRVLLGILATGSERARLTQLDAARPLLDLLVDLALRHPTARNVAGAFSAVLRRKGLSTETLKTQRRELLGEGHPQLADAVAEQSRLRAQIVRAQFAAEAGIAQMDELGALVRRREELDRYIARRLTDEGTPVLPSVEYEQVVAALPEGAALVELLACTAPDLERPALDVSEWLERRQGREVETRYVAFVLTGKAPDQLCLVNLGDARVLDRLISAYRSEITGGGASRDFAVPTAAAAATVAVGARLTRALWDPLRATLHARQRVFISPDAELTRLPFEALPVGNGHVIDDFAVSYLSAGRDLVSHGAGNESRPGPPMVVADPDFDLRGPGTWREAAGVRFGRLDGTRSEGVAVGTALGTAGLLLGYRATESALCAVHSPSVLHIATHGFFLPDPVRTPVTSHFESVHLLDIPGHGVFLADATPAYRDPVHSRSPALRRLGVGLDNPMLRSGLALAGANTWLAGGVLPDEAGDGILTAEEVSVMDLIGTELVVLSACETGLGDVVRGEGVFGLRRAFMLAGAATVVMSLWKVPDRETAELMGDFYVRLLSGAGRAEALREAQRAMKRRPGRAHPSVWAAFICQGEPGPLRLDGQHTGSAPPELTRS